MSTVFEKLLSGEWPCAKVYEDEWVFAFMDAGQVNDGHVTLKGVVRSPVERRRADILARALGAAGVENLLRVTDDSSPDKRGKRVGA